MKKKLQGIFVFWSPFFYLYSVIHNILKEQLSKHSSELLNFLQSNLFVCFAVF